MLAIPLLASLVLIGCLWILADVELLTKTIYSAVWLACSAGYWFSAEFGMLFAAALTVLDGLLWWVCFGPSPSGRR